MEDHQEKKRITYDMVDVYYLNNTKMSMAEASIQGSTTNFDSSCDLIFINQPISNSNVKNLCRTLLAYFHLSRLPGSSNNPSSYCGYSIYWLNNKVRKEDGTLEEYVPYFFNIFPNSTYVDYTVSECKNYIYDLGDDIFKRFRILFTFYEHYSNFVINKAKNPNASCVFTVKCIQIYKENIEKCLIYEDEFCSKLRKLKDKLMNDMNNSNICVAEQNSISQIDKDLSESLKQSQREESTAVTISASVIGIIFGLFLLLIIMYMVTPLGSWLSPLIGI
ncbi:PIR Superfamily Protein [Plasmodium ovale wallikeri]|uniref:PIR Superfamily Protein n=1 Tax=Plasmodium ovale wallikeri TaxID=864142 RepID=A0A1A9AMG3_PLAOA|nr:PIR Superfamily Protein [Plasmodium ovale wallikeri]